MNAKRATTTPVRTRSLREDTGSVPPAIPDRDAEKDRHRRHPEDGEEGDPTDLTLGERERRLFRGLGRDPDPLFGAGQPMNRVQEQVGVAGAPEGSGGRKAGVPDDDESPLLRVLPVLAGSGRDRQADGTLNV